MTSWSVVLSSRQVWNCSMLIKPISAIAAVILQAFGMYCEGEFKLHCGYPYIAVVLNFSQSWALYCLVRFYTATKDELKHIKPLAKFLMLKSIVFLTWWQGVALALLYSLGLFKSPTAQALEFKSSLQDFIICIERRWALLPWFTCMYFPAKLYKLMGDLVTGNVAVLGDYASVDFPLDPDEVRDIMRPTKLRLPKPEDIEVRNGMNVKDSVRDVLIGGGGYIVDDVKFTVSQAIVPLEKGINKFNEKIQKISQNIKKKHRNKHTKLRKMTFINASPSQRRIKGIDDPLLNGSISDSGVKRGKKHPRRRAYASGDSGGESSSDQTYYGQYLVRGSRWVTED